MDDNELRKLIATSVAESVAESVAKTRPWSFHGLKIGNIFQVVIAAAVVGFYVQWNAAQKNDALQNQQLANVEIKLESLEAQVLKLRNELTALNLSIIKPADVDNMKGSIRSHNARLIRLEENLDRTEEDIDTILRNIRQLQREIKFM